MKHTQALNLRQLPSVLPSIPPPVQRRKKTGSLDTLAQLGTELENPLILSPLTDVRNGSALVKRARAKYMTRAVVVRLASLDSPLSKAYWNSFHCCSTLVKTGDKIAGKYCKNRWCLVCNRIRTARLIQSYQPVLSSWPDKHFLTLTVPNVKAGALPAEIERMQGTLKTILEMFKKQYQRNGYLKIIGVRKFECTYNPIRNDFHPHFHIIVDSLGAASCIQAEWLRRFPDCSSKAQDIRPALDKDCLELFKYFTKIITKSKNDNSTLPINPQALDTIMQAITGVRTFQPFGFKLPEAAEQAAPVDEASVETVLDEIAYQWYQDFHDWISPDGDCLSGYTASAAMQELIEQMEGAKNEN
jgi:hypothetical protein